MRFSLRLNNDWPLPEIVTLAQAAEGVGFDQFWVSNDLFWRSGPVILSQLAGATSRIEIGSCIFNPYTIHPAELAMMAATLDELSGCRFNLGLAAGAANFLGWVGLRHERPVAAMRDIITAIRRLLAGERVPLDGPFMTWSEEAYLRFAAPRVTPIYLGALSPGMLALAGELADGALPLLFPPEHIETVQPLVAQGQARRAAPLPPLDLAGCVWVSLAEDRPAARRALAEKIAYYGPSLSPLILERLGIDLAEREPLARAMMTAGDLDSALALVDERWLRIGLVGDPAAVVERLAPLVGAGLDHLSFGPPLGPDPLQAVELLGRHVLPAFRSD